LFFCTEVLKLKSLHYGFVRNAADKIETLEQLQLAQQRYTDTLIDWIPEGVKSVLDVGCGIGDVSVALSKRGYQVTAISPDKQHARYFRDVNHGLKFFNQRFEDFKSDQPFDLILMCESHNYFDQVLGMEQSRKLLRPGGYLLVSGIFKTRQLTDINSYLSFEEEYHAATRERGFALISRAEITANILPTLDFARRLFRKFVLPTSGFLRGLYWESSFLERLAIHWFLKDRMALMSQVYQFYLQRLSRTFFEKNLAYLRYLFRYAGGL